MSFKDYLDIIQVLVLPFLGINLKLIWDLLQKVSDVNKNIDEFKLEASKQYATKDEVKLLIELHIKAQLNAKGNNDK